LGSCCSGEELAGYSTGDELKGIADRTLRAFGAGDDLESSELDDGGELGCGLVGTSLLRPFSDGFRIPAWCECKAASPSESTSEEGTISASPSSMTCCHLSYHQFRAQDERQKLVLLAVN
jgi:hypothetical protein